MNDEPTLIKRLQHMEKGLKENGMRYEAEVCHNAIIALERAEIIQTVCEETIAEPTNRSEYQAGKWWLAAQILRALKGEGEYSPEWLKIRRRRNV